MGSDAQSDAGMYQFNWWGPVPSHVHHISWTPQTHTCWTISEYQVTQSMVLQHQYALGTYQFSGYQPGWRWLPRCRVVPNGAVWFVAVPSLLQQSVVSGSSIGYTMTLNVYMIVEFYMGGIPDFWYRIARISLAFKGVSSWQQLAACLKIVPAASTTSSKKQFCGATQCIHQTNSAARDTAHL